MPLNVGLIGLKGHQGTILSGVQAMADARLAAVCDDEPATLEGVSGWPSKSSIRAAGTPLAVSSKRARGWVLAQ